MVLILEHITKPLKLHDLYFNWTSHGDPIIILNRRICKLVTN